MNKELVKDFYPFQLEGIEFLESRNGNGIIGDPMGLGKTIQALGYLKNHPELRPALVVCPASIKLNWRKEVRAWVGNEKVNILSGRTRQHGMSSNPNILIINYDILPAWVPVLKQSKIQVIIGDECQFISSGKAQRTKAFVKLSRTIPRKVFLSGTPIRNRPAEFYTVLNLLNPKEFDNRYRYLYRYCDPKYNGFGWTFKGMTHGDELREKVVPLMIRREKKEVLKDLPDKMKIVLPLEPSRVEMKAYEDAQEEFKEWVQTCTKKITIQNKMEHLKQMAYLAKRNQVVRWIKDYLTTGEKLVVFAVHRKAIKDLMEQFSDCAVETTGDTPLVKRQEAVDRFQTDDSVRLFIGQIQAAGIGITLTAAPAVAFVEFAWAPADHEQAEDRIHRIGQEAEAVFAYYLIADGTIENKIVKLLQRKQKVTSFLLDGKEKDFIEQNLLDMLIEEFGE